MFGLARFRPQWVRTGGSDDFKDYPTPRPFDQADASLRLPKRSLSDASGFFGATAGFEVVEEAVEAGVAPAREPGGFARQGAIRVSFGGIEFAQMPLDGREVAP